MQKKTKYKLRSSLTLPFCISIICCILGTTLCSFLFYKSFFKALTKINEEPIATITFKYKTAQRKFLERVVWDRLKQNSPVYNGDTIHTSALSEATIWFSDGNVMDLHENTMAQVYLSENNSLSANLSGGSATVDSSAYSNGVKLSTGGVEVSVKAGSALNASSASAENKNEGASFQVIKGQAEIASEKGSAQTITEGEAVSLQGEEVVLPTVVVTSPLPNEKILYHTEGNKKVDFAWNTNNLTEKTEVLFEIAEDKDFNTITRRATVTDISNLSIDLEPKSYYWKITAGNFNTQGKFTLIRSLPPELVAPVENYEYSYRTRTPAVRLIWTESLFATTYNLKIADNENLTSPIINSRTPMTSSIISTLKEGKYYWQVTPYFTINNEGFSTSSKVNFFEIKKQGELQKIELLQPANNGTIDTEDTTRGSSFSWKLDNEASSYTLLISKNQNLSSPVVKKETSDNYMILNSKESDITTGTWYWGIIMTDSEGNKSPLSNVNIFYAMKGKNEQHTIEPVDGYNVAESLVHDTQFTWKKNLPPNFTTEIQFAKDKDFTNISQSISVSGLSLKEMNLTNGTWYWRLYSHTSENDVVMATPAKSFTVQGPLNAAVQTEPLSRAVARESKPYEFKWNEVDGADFYKFKIYKSSDDSLVYEDNIYGTETSVDLFNKKFEDKAYYRWEIQPQSIAIPQVSSRRTGLLSEKTILLLKLKPVEIVSPKKNEKIDGIDAIINTPSVTWNSVDDVKKAQIVLSKTNGFSSEVIMKIPTDEEMAAGKLVAPTTVVLETKDGLRSGNYEVVVYAQTLDDIDISNTDKKNVGKFSITEIEPLENISSLTSTPELLNADYLIANKLSTKINFEWSSVKNATSYLLKITQKNQNEILYSEEVKGTSSSIDISTMPEDLKRKFSNGTFSCTVIAVRRIDTDKDKKLDKILQESKTKESLFKIDIPTPKKATAKGATNPYGN